MAKTIVGLEITEEGVRAAEVTVGKNPVVLAQGSVPLPAGAAKDSEVFDKDAVVLALRQLWTRAGIKGRNVVLGLGSRRILVREYTTTALRPDLLRQALPFQVQDLLPVPAEQAVLDFYPTSQEGDQVTGLLVAAVAETVEDLVATIAKAKLTVDVVDLAPFGLARAVARSAASGETVAALHLGDHTSHVVVVQDGMPRFVRIIPIDITTEAVRSRENAALDDLSIEQPVVEELLETVPANGDGPRMRRSRGAARGAVRVGAMSDAAIDDLVTRLGSTLRFYADRAADRPITRVLLTGAGAAVEGVADALAATLPMPVTVTGAVDVAQIKSPLASAEDNLNLVSTLGLTIGANV
ncbi:pilus assembly protein PilM [Microbacterium telephonicum]|uniref:Type IV pilus assembly protein PilM n=1 Tax=Microbacterium telephonicum TaxID=1714841 RepID=A0A498C6D1_9MICO|nr:pilus assembly protein PilM [Microbacterium telephonicum]RLK49696.1 type IV pilus assembly protein PilM [Microbacterium telephonicum]